MADGLLPPDCPPDQPFEGWESKDPGDVTITGDVMVNLGDLVTEIQNLCTCLTPPDPIIVAPDYLCVTTTAGETTRALPTTAGWYTIDPTTGLTPITVASIADPCDPACAPECCEPEGFACTPESQQFCDCCTSGGCEDCDPATLASAAITQEIFQ